MKKLLLILLLLCIAATQKEWITQNDPTIYGRHTITVVDVNKDETKCGINVDGNTKWMDTGNSEYFGNIYVKVFDVVAVYSEKHDKDSCELLIAIIGPDIIEPEVEEAIEEVEEVSEEITPIEEPGVITPEVVEEPIQEPEIIVPEESKIVQEKSPLGKFISFFVRIFTKLKNL